MHLPATKQPAYEAMTTAHTVLFGAALPTHNGMGIVDPRLFNEYCLKVGSMTNVLAQIVTDLQEREQVLNKQVADLTEYIVNRDATPEAHAAMAKAGVEYDLEETKRRLAEIAAKGMP